MINIKNAEKYFLIFSIAIGIFFRFYHLDYKVYWYDETQTSLRISGVTSQEFEREVYTGNIFTANEILRRYQYPNTEKDLNDTMRALSSHPEHSPLYFLLARFWHQWFGNTIATIRSLSAWIALLAFPAIYWLAREIFEIPAVAWFAVAIFSISPFHVLYAQEARQYSLWTLSIALSSAALLRALRLEDKAISRRVKLGAWSLYAMAIAFAFYTHVFTIFVLLGHGIYVFLESLLVARLADRRAKVEQARIEKTKTEKTKQRQKWIAFAIAAFGGILLFSPWLFVLIDNLQVAIENTISTTSPRPGLSSIWGLNLQRIFVDVNQGTSLFNPLLYLAIALAGYAIYWTCCNTPRKSWLFVIALMGAMGLALLLPDIFWGGRRSSITRYAIPCYLGIQLSVAYLLGDRLVLHARERRIFQRWKKIAIALLLCGVVSCAASAQHRVWWHKSYAKSRYNPAIAQIVNRTPRPLVASDEIQGRILSFLHLLNRNTEICLVRRGEVPAACLTRPILTSRNVFLYRPSDDLQQNILKNDRVRLERAYKKGWLWRIVPVELRKK